MLALPLCAGAETRCPTDRIDEQVRVSLAYDGDTVTLNDGRRVRLIGIDTPELGQRGQPHQPGALAARDRLRHLLLSHQQRLGLRFDAERQDKYGRLLAHAFFSDGSNLVEQLLGEGTGAQIVIPPNTWQAGCYQQAAQNARQQRRGVWALPNYQATSTEQLPLRSEGFRVVRGHVSHISNSASAVWVNLTGNVALRIERQDLPEFRNFDLEALAGSSLEAQGWVYARNGQLRMRIRHPAMLTILTRGLPQPPIGPVE